MHLVSSPVLSAPASFFSTFAVVHHNLLRKQRQFLFQSRICIKDMMAIQLTALWNLTQPGRPWNTDLVSFYTMQFMSWFWDRHKCGHQSKLLWLACPYFTSRGHHDAVHRIFGFTVIITGLVLRRQISPSICRVPVHCIRPLSPLIWRSSWTC